MLTHGRHGWGARRIRGPSLTSLPCQWPSGCSRRAAAVVELGVGSMPLSPSCVCFFLTGKMHWLVDRRQGSEIGTPSELSCEPSGGGGAFFPFCFGQRQDSSSSGIPSAGVFVQREVLFILEEGKGPLTCFHYKPINWPQRKCRFCQAQHPYWM